MREHRLQARRGASNRACALLFTLALGCALLAGYGTLGAPGEPVLAAEVLRRGAAETGAQNLVAAVYLDYRLFDTLLEALLLLVSVIGVTQFSRMPEHERIHADQPAAPRAGRHGPSLVMLGSLGNVYLLIALLGVYVIVTGMDGPGGGFQGGAILAAIVISAHFAQERLLLRESAAVKLEECMYVLILGVGICFLIGYPGWSLGLRRCYLLVMNSLIGAKVFAGLTILYLRFISCTPENAP